MTTAPGFSREPSRRAYDVVIVGGAIHGSATAFFLSRDPDFDGSVLVVEKDPSYARAATSLTNSCIRQQFSTLVNIRCSQFGAEFVRDFRAWVGDDAPALAIRNFGYLYLAATESAAAALRENRRVQAEAGVPTRLLGPDEIARDYPFYRLDDIVLGSVNTEGEGNFDGTAVFDGMRRAARRQSVEFVADEVVEIARDRGGARVERVTLGSGATVVCGALVNAAGTRAAALARMAGIDVPVEPRKRYSWIFSAARPIDGPLPLTIDPSGVHVRHESGDTYLAGSKGAEDGPVDPDDFAMDRALWEDRVWPALAARIPQFDALKVIGEWVGHYDYNTLDQNAIVGPHPRLPNYHFQCGFSGHGLQHAPAIGRGMAELLVHGRFRSLDLAPFGAGRVLCGEPFVERAVI